MSAPERLVGDPDVADMVKNWNEYHDTKTIRDLAIDLKNERRSRRELETQLELMTHHRNRLLDKREGFEKIDGDEIKDI